MFCVSRRISRIYLADTLDRGVGLRTNGIRQLCLWRRATLQSCLRPKLYACARLCENLLDKMMGAPGPRFPAKFSGFLALYAPFRIERRTRGPVQHYVQEIRGSRFSRPGILDANAGGPEFSRTFHLGLWVCVRIRAGAISTWGLLEVRVLQFGLPAFAWRIPGLVPRPGHPSSYPKGSAVPSEFV